MTSEIVLAVVQIFGVFLIGWLARRWQYIEEEEINRWSHFVVDVLFPLLVFTSIVRGFEAERVRQLWPLPFLGLGMIVFGALAGILLRMGVRSRDPDVVKTFHHFCAINNYGFLPIIIVQSLWGETGLANLFVFNLGSTVGYWTIGIGLLGEADWRKTARKIFSSNLIAVALALAVCLSGAKSHVPEVLLRITGSAGSATVPLMLLLIGASLYPLPSIRNKFDVAYITAVRLALLPFLAILILTALPLDRDVRNIAVIVALMPATVSSTIITRRYGGSPDYAARVAVVTTILSMVTIPVALTLLGNVITRG